jgi:tRNA modification GTPase
VVEKIGVERAKERAEASELLLCVFDGSVPENEQDVFIIECSRGKNAIAIINKCDKEIALSVDFQDKIKNSFRYIVNASAKNNDGYEELSKIIADIYDLGVLDISNDAIISSARQFSAVSNALECVSEARDALAFGETPDIVCFTLEKALGELNMIDARETSEELVNEIFSRFCVGK